MFSLDGTVQAYLFDKHSAVKFSLDDILAVNKFVKEFEKKALETGQLDEWARRQGYGRRDQRIAESIYRRYLYNKKFGKYWEIAGRRILLRNFPGAKFGDLDFDIHDKRKRKAATFTPDLEVNGLQIGFKSTNRKYKDPVYKTDRESYIIQYATIDRSGFVRTDYGQDILFKILPEERENHYIAAGFVDENRMIATLRGLWRWDFLWDMNLIEKPLFDKNQSTKRAIYLDRVVETLQNLQKRHGLPETSDGVLAYKWDKDVIKGERG